MMSRRVIYPCLLLLSACGSSPGSHYYTLAPSGTGSMDAFPGDDHFALGTVTIPGVLDKPQMVRKSGANEVEVMEYDRWAAPLDGMIAQVLTQDMVAHGGVSMPANGIPSHHRRIDVTIDEMMADASGKVALKARWTVTPPGENMQPASHSFEKSETSGGSVDDDVTAENHLLGELAEAILKE